MVGANPAVGALGRGNPTHLFLDLAVSLCFSRALSLSRSLSLAPSLFLSEQTSRWARSVAATQRISFSIQGEIRSCAPPRKFRCEIVHTCVD